MIVPKRQLQKMFPKMKLSEWRVSSKLPKHETDMIIERVCGLDRLHILIVAPSYELTQVQIDELNKLYDARYLQKYPLQYLLGYSYFMGLKFKVTPDVLIPRYDTEFLVSEAEKCISPLPCAKVLDLCTGSGCIAVCLADKFKNNKNIDFFASDISEKALTVAKENADNNDVNINFILSDMFDAFYNTKSDSKEKFDIILSNPPYIDTSEKIYMSEDTKNFEPELALYAEENGLEFYKKIASNYRKFLNPGGHVIMEIGFKQAEAVSDLFKDVRDIKIIKDLGGNDRVIHVFN